MDHFHLIMLSSCQKTKNFHYEVWCKPRSEKQYFQVFNACLVLTLEYFKKISLSLHLHTSFIVSFANSTRNSRLISGLEIKATRLSSSVRSLMSSISDAEAALGYSTFPSALGWGTPKHNVLACRGVSTHSSRSSVQGLTGARTQGSSYANDTWLLLPSQRWHFISYPQKLFNPLSASLPFNKCHCTSSSISVRARQGDRYGQMPQAQWVTHVTKHLTSSVPSISFQRQNLWSLPCGRVRLVTPQLLPRTQLLSSFPAAFPHFYQPVQSHLEDLSPLCRWISGPSLDLERVDSLASYWRERESKGARLRALQGSSQTCANSSVNKRNSLAEPNLTFPLNMRQCWGTCPEAGVEHGV